MLLLALPVQAEPLQGYDRPVSAARALLEMKPLQPLIPKIPPKPERPIHDSGLMERLALPNSAIGLNDDQRQQLWKKVQSDPEALLESGVYLPRTGEVFDWSVNWYRKSNLELPDWLVANDPRQRTCLEERAERGDYFSTLALAQLDPQKAKRFIDKMSNDGWKRGLEIRLQFSETREDAAKRLLDVYRQRSGDGAESTAAAHLLLSYDWSGRDEFFFRLLEDPYWAKPDVLTYPIDGYVRTHPEVVPRLVELVEDSRPAVHNNAVLALLSAGKEGWSSQVLAALLPWLEDLRWCNLGRNARITVIRGLGERPTDGAVPRLLRLIATSREQQEVYWAISSLESYAPPELPFACREALTKVAPFDAQQVAEIGLRHSLYSIQEQVDAVAALAEEEHGKDWLEVLQARYEATSMPPRKALALAVVSREGPSKLDAALVQLALKWRQLQKPQLGTLDDFLLGQSGPDIDAYLISRLGDSDISTEFLAKMLAKGGRLRQSSLPQLRALADRGGTGAGLAAVILDDSTLLERALTEGKFDETMALISSARYLHRPLNLASLETAVRRKPSLGGAARAYLDAFSEEPFRKLAERLNPDCPISGLRAGDKDFDLVETDLLKAYQQRPPGTLLYSLQSKNQEVELWLTGTSGELINRKLRGPQEPFQRRDLSREEVESIRTFMDERQVLNWGEWRAESGTSYQFLQLAASRGRRLPIRLDSDDRNVADKKYRELAQLFSNLAHVPATTIYPALISLPGGRVVERHRPTMTLFGDADGLKAYSLGEEGYDWRLLGPHGIEGRAEAPSYEKKLLPRPSGDRWGLSVPMPDHSYLVITNDEVYISKKGELKRHLLSGKFGLPTLNTDGTFCLLQRPEGEGWGGPVSLILLDLLKGKASSVDIPAAKALRGTAYLPHHQAFLVQRNEDEAFSSKQPDQWYLVDAASGKASSVTGEFRPWVYEPDRPLQSAGGTLYWVALPASNGTIVGLVDGQTFAFQQKGEYPGMHFSSRRMWVQNGLVYAAVEDDILELPLIKSP